MKKPIYTVSNFRKSAGRFERLYKKITNMMAEGSFWDLKLYERNALLRKLKLLVKRLEQFKLKTGVKIAGATLALTLVANTAFSQPFEKKTGLDNPFANTENPFSGLLNGDVGSYTVNAQTLADIDGDGDLDLLSGSATIAYDKFKGFITNKVKVKREKPDLKSKGPWDFQIDLFENTGTTEEPVYEEVEGTDNPFYGLSFPYMYFSDVVLADLDGDGDLDLSVSALTSDYQYFIFQYFENTGTAQEAEFTELTGTDNPLAFTFNDLFLHEFADIDNDGDLDLIVNYYGSIVLYENTGDSDNPAFVLSCSNPFYGILSDSFTETELVDIDDDGDLDLFVFAEPYGPYKIDFVRFYENIGSASSPLFQETGSPFDSFTAESYLTISEFADIDNDGDFDAVLNFITQPTLYMGADPIHYYRNDGTASSAEFTEIANFGVSYMSRPDLIDIDNDGDLDMAVGGYFGELLFFENQGTAEVAEFVEIEDSSSPFYYLSYFGNAVSPDFVDLDADGDFDLVIASSGGKAGLTYYENTGDAENPQFIVPCSNPFYGIPTNGAMGGESGFIDIDGDGDLDLFTQSGTDYLVLWRNIGDAENPSFSMDTCGNPFYNVAAGPILSFDFADFDNDGDTDMITGSYDYFNQSFAVRYFDNAGSSSAPLFDEQMGSNNPFATVNETGMFFAFPKIVDLDNDEDNDLILGDYFGDLSCFENLFINTSIETGVKSDLTIYPNPSDALFFVQMKNIQNIGVWNLNGQMLINKNVNSDNYMLDLSEYTKGLYFVKVITSEGEFNHKVILK
jgi:hypothetical protein